MKNLFTLLIGGLLAATCAAQAPQGFSYQAVLRDGTGAIEANTAATLGTTILQGSASGTVVYNENHAVTSNSFGLVNVTLGSGTVVTGTFASINWGAGPYFVRTSLNGTVMGTSKLESVPYALYAANAGSANISGTTNNLVKFTGTNTGGNSLIYESDTKIGIGTTTPTALLEVKGTGNASVPQLRLIQAAGGDGFSRIHFQNSNTGAWVLAGNMGSTAANSVFNLFHSGNANGGLPGADVLKISGQGKVGINGPDPTSTSDSQGMLGVKQYGETDALTLYDADDVERWGFYVGPTGMGLFNNGMLRGVFSNSNGTYSSSSDIRLKENIVPVASVLEQIKGIDVMRYTFKSDATHQPQLGYIAQNLEQHFPEFVNKPVQAEGKESFYTVNYAGMSAVAIKAIQEQQVMIESLQQVIATMQARLDKLEH